MRSGNRHPSLHTRGAKDKAKRDSSKTDYSKAEFMKTPSATKSAGSYLFLLPG